METNNNKKNIYQKIIDDKITADELEQLIRVVVVVKEICKLYGK